MDSINSANSIPQTSLIPDQRQIATQFGGDAAAELAAVVFLFARERSRDASEQRDLVENRIQSAEADQVKEMRKQADDEFWSGVLSGAGKVAGGAMQVTGGMEALGPTGEVTSEATANATTNFWSGMGQATAGGAEMGAAFLDDYASEHGIEAQKAGNESEAGKRDMDQVNDNSDEARDMSGRVLDFLDQIQEQKADAEKSMWVKA